MGCVEIFLIFACFVTPERHNWVHSCKLSKVTIRKLSVLSSHLI